MKANLDFIISIGTLYNKNGYYKIIFVTKLCRFTFSFDNTKRETLVEWILASRPYNLAQACIEVQA